MWHLIGQTKRSCLRRHWTCHIKRVAAREIDAVREDEGKEGKESVELPSNVTHFWLSIPAV